MRNLLFALGLGVACLSCAPKSREAERTVIDIDGLLDRQLGQLDLRKPTLKKEAGVNATVSDTLLVPEGTAWKSELDVFRTLGAVNQRMYSGAYVAEGPLDDPLSNLLVLQYTNQQAPLKRLQVYYQDETPRIRQIAGEVEENTLLYTAYRRLSLWFEDDQGQPLLSRYEIVGYQKAALRDTVRFKIIGTVQW